MGGGKFSLARAVLAGLVGTSWMTAVQELHQGGDGDAPTWENASAPAQVGRRLLRAAGIDPPPTWIPVLTQALHWGYGTTWGVLYALVRRERASGTVREGVLFGSLVWAASYAELVPVGIYEPPWRYEPKELAADLGYHLAFGIGVVTATDAVGFRRVARGAT